MDVSEKYPERRLIGAVVGSARDGSAGETEATLLGRALVDAGFRVVCGGLGGIMRAACRGARSSERYQPGDVIGVLPSYRAADANEFIDIPICTGLQHGRNLIVVATGDVVFAVGGRSGTLSEIALAWTLGKPVVCVGSMKGWATELAGRCIDDRREDQVHGPFEPAEAVAAAKKLLQNHRYGPKEF
jgi:uncharacterized protein (TIGR00725 family)